LGDRLEEVASAGHTRDFTRAVSKLMHGVMLDKEQARLYLRKYEAFYTGRTALQVRDRETAVAARALMYAVGKCRYSELIAPYIRSRAPPDCVIFAFAESKGIRLYYSLTEDAYLDMVVTRDRALEILKVNGFL
jgi:hypothetical protein